MAEQKLTAEQITERRSAWLGVIRCLAVSQGLYSRLWSTICAHGEDSEAVQGWLSQFDHCTDVVDFIMALEGG